MASEAKPFASLSSGLLARKGTAKPAMRPQGFGQGGASLEDLGWNDMGFEPPKAAASLANSDHDAFGAELAEHPRAHPTGLTPVESPVHSQQAQLADRLGVADDASEDGAEGSAEVAQVTHFEPAPAPAAAVQPPLPATAAPRASRAPRVAAGSKSKAAFTLRLDPDRHLKLRLACAVNGRSAQQLVTDALDQLLSAMPGLEAMAAKAKPKG